MFKKSFIISFLLLCNVAQAEYVIKFKNAQSKNLIPEAPESVNFSSCEEILNSEKNEGNGEYAITLGSGEELTVNCDMTTNGGGWMRIVADGVSLTEMRKFGDTSEIESTFYTNNTLGIGWATNDNVEKSYIIDQKFSFNEVYVQYSGSYDTPVGGLGYLYARKDGNNILSFNDSHTSGVSGQSLKINGTTIIDREQVNVVNRVDVLNQGPNEITMKGFTSSYPYTKRYIKNLWIR